MLTDLVLVERPRERVVGGLDGDVADEGDAHVGVRLQAEGDDRHHDEEHRHHASHLEEEERLIDPARDGSLAAQYNLHLFFDSVVCGESLGRARIAYRHYLGRNDGNDVVGLQSSFRSRPQCTALF